MKCLVCLADILIITSPPLFPWERGRESLAYGEQKTDCFVLLVCKVSQWFTFVCICRWTDCTLEHYRNLAHIQTMSLFRYPFHPRVTAVARKRPQSFCQKRRWQVTAKHTYTLRIHVALHEVTRCMVVWCTQNAPRLTLSGSRFLWHQPCQRCKYTTSVDIQKRAIKSYSLL